MRYLVWVVLFALGSVGVSAQDTRGNISGTVTDPQGGVLPGVAVIVTNTGTGTTTRLTTNASGYYEAPLLLPGDYSVTVEITDFKQSVRSGLTLAMRRPVADRFPARSSAAPRSRSP